MRIQFRNAARDDSSLFAMIVHEAGDYLRPRPEQQDQQSRDAASEWNSRTRVALADGQVAGFHRLLLPKHPTDSNAELDFLFVHHRWRAHGIGRALFADMTHLAAQCGTSGVNIVSHPRAETFYRRLGAHRTGFQNAHEKISWSCPVLHLDLAPNTVDA